MLYQVLEILTASSRDDQGFSGPVGTSNACDTGKLREAFNVVLVELEERSLSRYS